ncbi:MAG: hypothetical protein GQE15_33935 [Archangiaceae bacterium]|nr:hypothetical protein [Archangiaceae bacterium]
MKFAFLYRKSIDPNEQPSAAAMQEGYVQWRNWMAKHAQQILDQPPPRSGPKPGGKVAVCRKGTVSDGPYVEGKEVVGGWSFIESDSFESALAIAREVPMFASVEVLEITSF